MRHSSLFSPRDHRGRAGLPPVRHVEPGRAAVRDAVRPAALQGGERGGDEGEHRQREVQVRVALQGGHHGGHEAAHVDLQEDALVSISVPLLVYRMFHVDMD